MSTFKNECARRTAKKFDGACRDQKVEKACQRHGVSTRKHICTMSKYKDALRIIKHRLAFFRGEVPEAGGKELLARVLKSTDELKMLEEIENLYAPTSYSWEPGMHVDYITPEVCRHIQLIYLDKGLGNDEGNDNPSGQEAADHTVSSGGGEPKYKRLKT